MIGRMARAKRSAPSGDEPELSDKALLHLPPIALTAEQNERRAKLMKGERRVAKGKPRQPNRVGAPNAKRIKPAKRVPIHRPGQDPMYTDAELLELAPSMLNAIQRERREKLQNRQNANARRQAMKKATGHPRSPGTKRGTGNKGRTLCIHTKDNGDQCGAFQSYGTEHCRHHLTEEEKFKAGLVPDPTGIAGTYTRVPLLGARTILTPQQQYRRVAEIAFAHMINKKLAIFGLTLEGFDPHGEPILGELPGGGLKLHGESKDGYIVMTEFEDILGMDKVFEGMQDRVFGKARQALQIEGGGKPIEIKPVRSGERAREVAGLLDQFGVIPRQHSGRQRRTPAKPTDKSKVKSEESE